jgi:Na+(H+)/acetate symporter ActP
MISIVAIALVVVASSALGALSLRYSRTTSDFLVASRTVSPRLNAAAVCGEYLSAGTFLGLSGLVMVFGFDMIWYPVGYTAGYLILLVLVAGPLRRFGSYTIPEFAQGRLDSPPLRRLAAVFVLLISFLYLLPQMKGAGISLRALTGAPYWVGVVLVAVVVGANVALGGMRGVTYVQAFQYVVKLCALAIAAVILWAATLRSGPLGTFENEAATVSTAQTVVVASDSVLRLREVTTVTAQGVIDGALVNGEVRLLPGTHGVDIGTEIRLPAGAPIPLATRGDVAGENWYRPFQASPRRQHPTYLTLSLIVATVLGTMGLPHIVTRFYTNPDAKAARRTIVSVVAMLGVYYIWPIALGVLGRRWAAELIINGGSDAVVLLLPERILGPTLGARLLTGLLSAGAFAAFLSTSSGLLVAVAGAVSHDLLDGGVKRFRWAAGVGAVVIALMGLGAQRFEINVLVGWAFAIAASSFSPLLVLGVWWPRFTSVGAAAGLLVGGGSASAAIAATMAGFAPDGWLGALCSQPAAWTVPLAVAACVIGSVMSPGKVPEGTKSHLARMHRPEASAG